MTGSIHQYVAVQELEIAQLRNALLIASQYASAFPNDALIMPDETRAWIAYRIQYLMALQTQLISGIAAPAVVAPGDVSPILFSTPLQVPSNAVAPVVSAAAQGS